MKKVTLDGAMMRNKLRGRLAKEVAECPFRPKNGGRIAARPWMN